MNIEKDFKICLKENIDTHFKIIKSIKQIDLCIREIAKAIKKGNKLLL